MRYKICQFAVCRLALAVVVVLPLTFAPTAGAQDAEQTAVDLLGPADGQFAAATNGAATFRISILAPPGTAGLEPALAFAYDSRTRAGLLGPGWSIDGLPAIVRCGATRAQDGFNGGIQFGLADRFCLDGQRLIAISGRYGDDRTEYRTELESFARIVSYDSTGGASGPRSFRVWMKSGRVMTFGLTADSRIEAPGKSGAYAWALSSVSDRSGNTFTVTYEEIAADGEYRPLRIDYTANPGSGLMPTRRIEFEYEARTDIATRFVAGSRIRLTGQLRRVASYAGSALAREYRLGYEATGLPGDMIVRLTSIVECGSAECLPAWRFGTTGSGDRSFQQGAVLSGPATVWRTDTAKALAGDVNGDGLTDLVQIRLAANTARVALSDGAGTLAVAWNSPTSASASGYVRSSNAYASALGDVNGDGKADLIQVGKTTAGAYVLLSNGDGSFTSAWTSPASGDGSVFTADRVVVQDFNGDGLADIMLIRLTNQVRLLLSRGDGSFTTAWDSAISPPLSGFLYGTMSAVTYVGDVNGDRIPDLLQITLGNHFGRVLLGAGDGSFVTTWTSPSGSGSDGFMWSIQSGQTAVGDINGDGLMDVIQIKGAENKAYVHLARGDGSFSTAWLSPPGSTDNGYMLSGNGALTLVGDVNGDGKADVVQVFKNLNQGRVLLSRGDGSFNTGALSPPHPQNGAIWNAQATTGDHLLVDMNGDGSADLVQIRKTIDTGHQIVLVGTGQANLLSFVASPLGRGLEIQMAFLTNASVHQREVGSVYPTVDRPRAEPVVALTRAYELPRGDSYPGTETFYRYGGVKYDLLGRGSLGFRWRRLFDTASTTNVGTSVTTFFNQIFPAMGSVQASEVRSGPGPSTGAGALLRATANQWSYVATSPGSFFQRLDQTDDFDCDGAGTCRQTSQGFLYDAYGNLERAHHFGDVALSGDERDEYIEWNVDPLNWLHRPRRTVIFGAGGELLRERWISYDGLDYGLLGGRGLPTRDEARLEGDRGAAGNYVVAMTYDSVGNPSVVTDARGCATTTFYEPMHQTYPETVTTCLGHSARFVYDARWGQAARYEDENGQATAYQYDTVGRLRQIVGPLDAASTYGSLTLTYLDLGTSTQRVITYRTEQHGTANAHWTEHYFDGLGRVLRVRSEGPAGQVIESETAFDVRGRVTSRSVPHFPAETASLVRFTYDPLRRLTRVQNPDGTAVTTSYAPGRVSVTDERQKVRRYFFDAFDRLVRVEEVNDVQTYATTYAFDAAGTLREVRNHLGHVTQIEPDYLGRTRMLDDPNTGLWTFSFDASGTLVQQTDARHQTLTFAYDLHGRIRFKTYPSGARIEWTYDDPSVPFSKGRLTRVTDLATTTAFRYDAVGRPTQVQRTLDGNTYTVSHSYDARGRNTRQVFPDGDIVDYAYNDAGWLASVRDGTSSAPYIAQVDYNARGQSTRIQYGNGVTSTLTYFDDAPPRSFQLKRIVTTGPGGLLQDLGYEYDASGNISNLADGTGTATRHYQYDALGRVTQASGTFGPTQTPVSEDYAYDAAGNIISKAGVVYTYSDLAHPGAVTSRSDGTAYSYDANGSIIRVDPGRTHDWDADNQLARVVTDAGTTTAFAYDFTGRRVRKTINGASVTRYPFREVEIGPGTVTKYFAGVLKRSGDVFFTHSDHLDGGHVWSGSGGTSVQLREYGPWGEMSRVQGAADTSRGFTGQEVDAETQLLYYGGRYYDPLLARFISADPIGGTTDNPQSWNPYSYVLNRPTRFTDPTGFCVDARIDFPFGTGVQTSAKDCLDDGGVGGNPGRGTTPPPKPVDPGPGSVVAPTPAAGGGSSSTISTAQSTDGRLSDRSQQLARRTDLSRTVFTGSASSLTEEPGLETPLLDPLDLVNLVTLATIPPRLLFRLLFKGAALIPAKSGARLVAGQGFHSFAAFKYALGSAGPNQHWHHIVEQTAENVARFGAMTIHNTQNVVRLEASTHRAITSLYQTKPAFANGQTIREWLSGQTFEQQRQFGLDILQQLGITP